MDCTAPGQFSAERLLAFASGEFDGALAAHLPTCAACAEALAGYTAAEHALRAVLYRADCVTTMELGELALDLLPPERATIVRAHVVGCPYCGAEFADLRAALSRRPITRPRSSSFTVPAPDRPFAVHAGRGYGLRHDGHWEARSGAHL